MKLFAINPITLKRWRRFRQLRRGWYSFCLMLLLFVVVLAAEIVANDKPLILHFAGHWYFPVCKFYPEDTFLHNGIKNRTDYRKIQRLHPQDFRAVWPLFRCNPYSFVAQDEILPYLRKTCRLRALPRAAVLTIGRDGKILRSQGLSSLELTLNDTADSWEKLPPFPQELQKALQQRTDSTQALERQVFHLPPNDLFPQLDAVLSFRETKAEPPDNVRLTLRFPEDKIDQTFSWNFLTGQETPSNHRKSFRHLPENIQAAIRQALAETRGADDVLQFQGRVWKLTIEQELLRLPFRPVHGHPLGLDEAGRDVLARIIYGLRSAMLFGLILVVCSMTMGTLVGIFQGYTGGWWDILGQRFIEIWSSLPFLYVIILLGSIYGPGFGLLIFCYALFNWISISYYMRAEILRLRKLPFVEAAKCLGLPAWKIALKHLLPNALVPLITFFPFNLVGAIGALASLDYLGFGLPPPTPSLGQLLQQAQSQTWAWWLILYPSLTLFIVMLLGIFIGEGVRDAFDPRKQARLQ